MKENDTDKMKPKVCYTHHLLVYQCDFVCIRLWVCVCVCRHRFSLSETWENTNSCYLSCCIYIRSKRRIAHKTFFRVEVEIALLSSTYLFPSNHTKLAFEHFFNLQTFSNLCWVLDWLVCWFFSILTRSQSGQKGDFTLPKALELKVHLLI